MKQIKDGRKTRVLSNEGKGRIKDVGERRKKGRGGGERGGEKGGRREWGGTAQGMNRTGQ